ncbi:MAG: DHH family phosphoesterase [Ruminococcus sp.]|nr:DHH family phosphoesterase [Ruminococcus sp.]
MQRLTLEETARHLEQSEDVYVLIHRSPDGDCIGGGYALAEMLHQMGKRAKVICNDPIPARYAFMLPKEESEDFSPKFILSIDVADPKLLGKEIESRYGKNVDLCIDHHASYIEFAAAGYVDGTAAAACQVVCQMLAFFPEVVLTDSMATCLYTGIATDTGCFQYDNAGALIHMAVADLMTCCPGVDYSWINRKMFGVKSMGRLKLDQQLIDRLEIYLDGKCVLICITREFLDHFQIEDAELDGIASFPLQVEGAEVGITMKERETGKFRVSMWSADWVDVSQICQSLGGGGHIKASGCMLKGTEAEVRRILLEAVQHGMEQQCRN